VRIPFMGGPLYEQRSDHASPLTSLIQGRIPSFIVANARDVADLTNCVYAMILRASPSGSSTMRHSLSQTIVLLVSGSVGSHFKPGTLGLPVAANAAHDEAIFFASACASGVLPVPCSQRLVLSKQN
jgi:hypothetical protein